MDGICTDLENLEKWYFRLLAFDHLHQEITWDCPGQTCFHRAIAQQQKEDQGGTGALHWVKDREKQGGNSQGRVHFAIAHLLQNCCIMGTP
jgi:hypothetical protein